MTFGQTNKLAIAIFGSAALHAAILFPLHALTGPQIAAPKPQAFLSARIMAAPAPLPPQPVTPVDTPLSHEMQQRPEPTEPAQSSPAMEPRHRADPTRPDPVVSQSAALPPTPQSSGDQDGQNRPGVRVAKPDEVKVRVIKYASGADDNPNEVMETDAGKYVYFNAPRLKQSTYPIADTRPHYPLAKLEYPHGAVTLLLQIDENGALEKTSVMCANPAFRDSAIASIKDMRFGPAVDATGPVKSYMIVEFAYGVGAPCGPLPHNLQLGQRPG